MEKQIEIHNDADRFRKLRIFNVIMGLLHFLQAAVMVAVSSDFSLPLQTNYLTVDPDVMGPPAIASMLETVGDLVIGPVVASFLVMSAIAHLLLAGPLYKWYVRNLKQGINKARWVEYSVSSSVMIVVIAMLSGMYDLPSLILIFALNAMMNLFGYLMELQNLGVRSAKKVDWTAFWFGVIAGIVPWVVISMYFFGAASSVDAIPDFVYAILASLFLFFNVFAINMWLQYKKIGPWKNYLFGETMFIVLSLTAKSALAWQVWSGTLRPE